VGPTASLDDVDRRNILPLPGLELRPLGRPASSQSLYRLSLALLIWVQNWTKLLFIHFSPFPCPFPLHVAIAPRIPDVGSIKPHTDR
jgi:hypothetical protein